MIYVKLRNLKILKYLGVILNKHPTAFKFYISNVRQNLLPGFLIQYEGTLIYNLYILPHDV
jgi:hypothetical protein